MRRLRKIHPSRGFSLIEILIAIIVLAIGIMGMLGALSFGLKASENSSRMAKATNFSRRLLERIIINSAWDAPGVLRASDPPFLLNDPSTWTPVDASPFNTLFNDAGDRAMFYRRIQYIQAGQDPDGDGVSDKVVAGSTWEDSRLARVKVTIIFYDKASGAPKTYTTWAYCSR